MNTRNHFTKVVSTAIIFIFFSATSPQDAFADHGWRTLVGSWLVAVEPSPGDGEPFTNLATLNWPGTIVAWDPELGAGQGAWKRTGRRDFELSFLFLPVPGAPVPPSTTKVSISSFLTVDNSGDKAEGTVFAEFLDSDGNVLMPMISGDVSFTRIKVD